MIVTVSILPMSELPEDSIRPTLPTGESYEAMYRKKMTNSDRAIKSLEACALFPDTSVGLEASETVMDLIDQLHRAPLGNVEDIFKGIRLIFQSFKIQLDI
jgi:hypothetical protein